MENRKFARKGEEMGWTFIMTMIILGVTALLIIVFVFGNGREIMALAWDKLKDLFFGLN